MAVLGGCTSDSDGTSAAPTTSAAESSGSPANSAAGLQDAYQRVITNVLPSVVEIRSSTGLGSGVVYDDAGHIVTNAHVVGADKDFDVLTSGSATPLQATLVGTFQPNDIAVIKVEDPHGLVPATFADSSEVRVGDIVLAMGNPLGLSATVTDGIVSALGREVSEPATDFSPPATLPNMIQTSAAINPGNSGGALVNLDGHVIGVPTAAATNPEAGGLAPGIGFAVPSNTVKRLADQLVATGTVTDSGRAALGVGVTTVVDNAGRPQGVGVISVQPGGPADQAGIQPGDIIVAVNGTTIASTQALGAVLADLEVGTTVPVTVRRDGDERQLQVTLGEL
ncbi:S1C family serine protease [Blastococcus sp. KM273129]|uniref:S1C family serine protease n=1 Tax=Blastococcus sp. KM273129 TaxID=2570315 RepID=UPI001F2C3CF7|nr:trypsin-like peptidase domain-containing protein [Blastococcus sp. KM273129]